MPKFETIDRLADIICGYGVSDPQEVRELLTEFAEQIQNEMAAAMRKAVKGE